MEGSFSSGHQAIISVMSTGPVIDGEDATEG
jgi:hypothetical protein